MVDKKLTNPEPVSFRRSTMIRELALAKFHSRIGTGPAIQGKRSVSAPAVPPEQIWPSPSVMPDDMELHDFVNQKFAEQFKELTRPDAPAPPSVEPSRRRFRDNPNPPESGAKPWKKPWEI
jgi:hypothetical protein